MPDGPMATLVYDGDCAFCTRTAAWAASRFRVPVTVVPGQAADLGALGLTAHDVTQAAWWIEPDGTRRRGHEAIALAFSHMRGWWPVLGRLALLPPLSLVARGVYVLVARNRHRLPGATDRCRLPTGG